MSKVTLRTKNPCWKNYKPVGTKKKNGKTVPNCVPEEYRNISRKAGLMTKQAAKAGVKAGIAKMGAHTLATGGLRNEIRRKVGLNSKERNNPNIKKLKDIQTKHASRAAKIANIAHNHKPGVAQAQSRLNTLRGIEKTRGSLENMHSKDIEDKKKNLEKSYSKSVNEFFLITPKRKKNKRSLESHNISSKSKETARRIIDKEIEKRKKEREKLRTQKEELDPKGPLISYKSVSEIAKKHNTSVNEIKVQLKMGLKVETEHTKDESKARAIALHHLEEDPKYYSKLQKVEGSKTVSEAYRMQAQTGNILSVLVTWRGKYLNMQMFFPKLGFPTRKEVEYEIQKIYPDSRLIRYKRMDYDQNYPIIKVTEESKSEMPCNKPKAQAVGDSKTGKSHVVKACVGGKEKLIRFGQRGVKGSPKKEGESEDYATRRKSFNARHAKNIAKGKMSAAFWSQKVKW